MITHVVLLDPKPETSEAELAAVFNQIEQMQEKIAGIISIKTGKNSSTYNNGYTYGFVVQFTNEQFFSEYVPYPAHKPVIDELQRICQNIIDFDL